MGAGAAMGRRAGPASRAQCSDRLLPSPRAAPRRSAGLSPRGPTAAHSPSAPLPVSPGMAPRGTTRRPPAGVTRSGHASCRCRPVSAPCHSLRTSAPCPVRRSPAWTTGSCTPPLPPGRPWLWPPTPSADRAACWLSPRSPLSLPASPGERCPRTGPRGARPVPQPGACLAAPSRAASGARARRPCRLQGSPSAGHPRSGTRRGARPAHPPGPAPRASPPAPPPSPGLRAPPSAWKRSTLGPSRAAAQNARARGGHVSPSPPPPGSTASSRLASPRDAPPSAPPASCAPAVAPGSHSAGRASPLAPATPRRRRVPPPAPGPSPVPAPRRHGAVGAGAGS